MKKSNLVFSSNIYVLQGHAKFHDPNFMSQVIDPGAIVEIADNQLKMAGKINLSPLQQEIYNNYMPCSYADGDYTHGSIFEDGKVICVNKCENIKCKNYSKCSAKSDFRRIDRDADANFDFVKEEIEEEKSFDFDIDLPERKSIKKIYVKKLTSKKYFLPQINTEIEAIVRNNIAEEWSVRSHVRRLANGRVVAVKGHVKSHNNSMTIASVIKKVNIFKHVERKKQITKGFIKNFGEKIESKDIENILESSETYQLKNTKFIDSSKVIVESPLDSKILVNAGPGTGKTHTVIERLKYIAQNNEDINPENCLVLCFSRSAVKVIRDRLNKAMENREIPYIAKRFEILTFDSFVTGYLKQLEPNFDLSSYSYDDRIWRFIEKYTKHPETLDNLEYLIVDEVQDLVGCRARMVQTLLEKVNCGFLLLGDICQAIYDYQITNKNELNASRLYEWLQSYFDASLEVYELTKVWRYQGELEQDLKPLRHSMISLDAKFSDQKEQVGKLFQKYDIPGMNTEDIIYCCDEGQGKRAILSWANGDAYRQSQELFLRDDISIKHTILTGSRKILLRKELALILGMCTVNRITKRMFYENGRGVSIAEGVLDEIWNAIMYTLDVDLDCDEFLLATLRKILISEKNVDESLTVTDESDVVISTIHKAKGKEYDTVVLNRFGKIANLDDIKVYYVAMTRSKKELFVKTKSRLTYDIKTDSGRFIEVNSQNKLKRIELGIDGDVDYLGFVDSTLHGMDYKRRQDYIANNVKIGDPIKISKHRNEYLIIHEGHVIGRVNSKAFNSYRHYFNGGSYYLYKFDKFTDFVDLFVKDIVSVVNQRIDKSIPEPYASSGLWLGIEICGYAKPMEE